MKLYQLPYSHFSAKVGIVLLEKGLQVDYPAIPDASSKEEAEIYKKINPTGKVPCLVDGDFAIGESEVIAEYLEGQYPDVAMLPVSEKDQARSRWLSRYHDLYVAPQITVLFLMSLEEDLSEDEITSEVNKLFDILDVLENAVVPAPYFFGNRFCLCDASHFLSFWYALFLCEKFSTPLAAERFPKLVEWYRAASQRDSTVEVLSNCRNFHGLDDIAMEQAA